MALLLCLGTFLTRPACAQNTDLVELDELQKSCMSRNELAAAVLTELGAIEVPEGLRVQVELGENPGFILRDTEEVVSERRFESLPLSCEAQLRMLSVVIALAIEHKVASEDAEERTAALEPPAENPRKPPVAVVPKAVKPPRAQKPEESDSKVPEVRKSWGLRGSSGVGYSFGVLPVPAPIISAELGVVVFRGWSVELGVMATDVMRIGFDVEAPNNGVGAPDEAFSKALGRLLAGKAQGCFERFYEDGAFGMCGGMAAGRFHVRGVEGFRPNPGEGVPWMAAFSRLTGRVPARGPFGVSLNADIFANILRPGVELTGEGSVQKPVDTPVAGGFVSLGMFFVIQ